MVFLETPSVRRAFRDGEPFFRRLAVGHDEHLLAHTGTKAAHRRLGANRATRRSVFFCEPPSDFFRRGNAPPWILFCSRGSATRDFSDGRACAASRVDCWWRRCVPTRPSNGVHRRRGSRASRGRPTADGLPSPLRQRRTRQTKGSAVDEAGKSGMPTTETRGIAARATNGAARTRTTSRHRDSRTQNTVGAAGRPPRQGRIACRRSFFLRHRQEPSGEARARTNGRVSA